MKFILSILIIFTVVFVGAVFYFSHPKDLGIKYSEADLKSIHSKLAVKFESLPTNNGLDKTLVVSGAHPVDQFFSSQELTAGLDNRQSQYAYFPFQNVQIRVNNDGTVEGSGTVTFNSAVNYLVALGVSYQDIISAASKFNVPKVKFPVYMKISGSVTNNISSINVQQVTIANIPVPGKYVNQYGPGVNDLVDKVIKERQPSYNIEKLEVVNGKVHFKGTSPDVEMAAKSL